MDFFEYMWLYKFYVIQSSSFRGFRILKTRIVCTQRQSTELRQLMCCSIPRGVVTFEKNMRVSFMSWQRKCFPCCCDCIFRWMCCFDLMKLVSPYGTWWPLRTCSRLHLQAVINTSQSLHSFRCNSCFFPVSEDWPILCHSLIKTGRTNLLTSKQHKAGVTLLTPGSVSSERAENFPQHQAQKMQWRKKYGEEARNFFPGTRIRHLKLTDLDQ